MVRARALRATRTSTNDHRHCGGLRCERSEPRNQPTAGLWTASATGRSPRRSARGRRRGGPGAWRTPAACGTGSRSALGGFVGLEKRPPVAATSSSAAAATIPRDRSHASRNRARTSCTESSGATAHRCVAWSQSPHTGSTASAGRRAPPEPPALDVGEVVEQLERRPAGRQHASPLVFLAHLVELAQHRRAVAVEIAESAAREGR